MMTLCLRLLALVATILSSPQLAAQNADRPEPSEKRVYKKIGDTSLEIWIYKPAGWKANDSRSAIVFYHGGGWRGGNPNAFSRQAEKLAARGMVAFSVQYRLTSKAGVMVLDCVKDAKSAFRWVRTHAQELGINPEKIAAGGGSAGGHLAAALATLDEINDPQDNLKVSTRPAALVLFNPALRLKSPREEDAISPGAPSRATVSPYEHVKRGHPPTIILHGEADTTVPIQSVRDYAAKVKHLGGDCTVVGFADQVHAFFNREPFVWDTLKQAEAFLEKQALLSKDSRVTATNAPSR